MFTGIIEGLGKVASIRRITDSMRLGVDLAELSESCKNGDSIALNGVCLTVAGIEAGTANFDVSGETLAKSTINKLASGSAVNIERAMKADGRFGGHFVQGHVDGTAKIERIEQQGRFRQISLAAGSELLEQMVLKGSIAVDGASLTIAGINERAFNIAVIPETLKRTTLGTAKIGDEVNIEIDILTKSVRRQLDNILPGRGGLTIEKLEQMGF